MSRRQRRTREPAPEYIPVITIDDFDPSINELPPDHPFYSLDEDERQHYAHEHNPELTADIPFDSRRLHAAIALKVTDVEPVGRRLKYLVHFKDWDNHIWISLKDFPHTARNLSAWDKITRMGRHLKKKMTTKEPHTGVLPPCIVCGEGERVFAYPCGHVFACNFCIWALKRDNQGCSFCRQPIKKGLKMFIAD